MPGPLNGLRVIELGAIGPAPFAGGLLADLGADVVRIDRQAPKGASSNPSPQFDFYNRNKRSLALDLKHSDAIKTVLRMVRQSDVLLEGFRPGVTERLGLGPQACMDSNPLLVYGRMTGWGQSGPLAQVAGHDINYLALTGALHSIGIAGQPPSPPLNLVADLGGGAMYLAMGVLAATIEAQRSGQFQIVDAAMIDGVVHLMSAFQAFRQCGTWTSERGENIVDGGAHFYGTYKTQDGKYIALGAIEPHFYAALIQVLGLDHSLLPDQNDRKTWPKMRTQFATIFLTKTRDEWVHIMAGRDACFSPVLSIDEAPQHPQMQQRDVFQKFDGVLHPSPAPRFSKTPGALRRPAPAPGQHSEEVLAEWGLTADEINALQEVGAMHQACRTS
jgi:alpha-methylacyl-CoA racemase